MNGHFDASVSHPHNDGDNIAQSYRGSFDTSMKQPWIFYHYFRIYYLLMKHEPWNYAGRGISPVVATRRYKTLGLGAVNKWADCLQFNIPKNLFQMDANQGHWLQGRMHSLQRHLSTARLRQKCTATVKKCEKHHALPHPPTDYNRVFWRPSTIHPHALHLVCLQIYLSCKKWTEIVIYYANYNKNIHLHIKKVRTTHYNEWR